MEGGWAGWGGVGVRWSSGVAGGAWGRTEGIGRVCEAGGEVVGEHLVKVHSSLMERSKDS